MRKRARIVVIGLGLVTAALVCSLFALEPHALAVHAVAWWARMGGGEVLWPRPGARVDGYIDFGPGDIVVSDLFQFIADSSGRAIVVEGTYRKCLESTITIVREIEAADSKRVLCMLRTSGMTLSLVGAAGVWSVGPTEPARGMRDYPTGRRGAVTGPSASR